MDEIIYQKNYSEYKQQLDSELQKSAEGFVRIGYLLKVARDTNVLEESGYTTVAEFALAEYNLSKDIVSRYIAINDRYSKNGYSEELEEKYQGYGVAKLQEMLTLPDVVVDLVNQDISKRQIQDLKKEIKEEEQISDIEVLLEPKEESISGNTLPEQAMYKLFIDNYEEYKELTSISYEDYEKGVEHILNVLAPSGFAVKTVRISGVGKIMISFRGKDEDIVFLNTRSHEQHSLTWHQFIFNIVNMRIPAPEVAAVSDNVEGQKNIDEYPEYMPDEVKTEESKAAAVDEKPINTPCDDNLNGFSEETQAAAAEHKEKPINPPCEEQLNPPNAETIEPVHSEDAEPPLEDITEQSELENMHNQLKKVLELCTVMINTKQYAKAKIYADSMSNGLEEIIRMQEEKQC